MGKVKDTVSDCCNLCFRSRATLNPVHKGRHADLEFLPFVSDSENRCNSCRTWVRACQYSVSEIDKIRVINKNDLAKRGAYCQVVTAFEAKMNESESGRVAHADAKKLMTVTREQGVSLRLTENLGVFWPADVLKKRCCALRGCIGGVPLLHGSLKGEIIGSWMMSGAVGDAFLGCLVVSCTKELRLAGFVNVWWCIARRNEY